MSFPINVNIPNAPNDPGDDQPKIKQNFGNISGFLSVDHVAPGTSTLAGSHNKSTYPVISSAFVPTAPGLLALFNTNLIALAPSQLFYTRDGSPSSFAITGKLDPSATSNGYTSLIGNIYIQWGLTGLISSTTSVNFNTNFPNACFAAIAVQAGAANAAAERSVSIISVGPGAFTPRITTLGSTPSDSAAAIFWMAIGN